MSENPKDAGAWAAGHADWSRFASAVYESVRETFHTLAEIRFGAPWQAEPARIAPKRRA